MTYGGVEERHRRMEDVGHPRMMEVLRDEEREYICCPPTNEVISSKPRVDKERLIYAKNVNTAWATPKPP